MVALETALGPAPERATYIRTKEAIVDLQAFGVKFDVYYLESSLYTEGKVDAVVKVTRVAASSA